MKKTQHIAITEIKTEGLQTRAAINMDVVREYAEAEQERGAILPPVVVFQDSVGAYWLADGFHRLAVARQNGSRKVACEVREGTRTDALRFALGANGAHGLRRTNADKANAVKLAYENRIALGLGEVPSARAMAELVGVHHTFAGNQLATVATWREATERVGADGKIYSLPPVPTRKPTENGDFEADGASPKGAELPPPPTRASRAGAHEVQTARPLAVVPLERQGGKGVPPVPVRGAGGYVPVGRGGDGSQETGAVVPPVPERRAGPVDGRGKPMPPDLMPVWNRRAEVRELAGLVSRVRVALRKAQDGSDPLWAEMSFSSALAHLDRAYTEITAAEPWCVCPMCQGIGCRACKGRGLMGEFRYKTVPREFKGGTAESPSGQ